MGILTCHYCKEPCTILRIDESDDSGQGEWFDYVSNCCYDEIIELCEDLTNEEIAEFCLSRSELRELWQADKEAYDADRG